MQKKGKSKGTKQSRVVLTMFALFMLIALALSVNAVPIATPIISLPASSGSLTENSIINISGFGTMSNVTACAVYVLSSNTANSTKVVLVNITNTTTNDADSGDLNITLDSNMILEDSNVYVFSAKCYNTTGGAVDAADTTSVLIDRTVPSTPTSLSPANNADNTTDNQVFTVVVNGANTTGCSLKFSGANPGQSAYAMTHSGDACTLTINGIARGDYSWYATATDSTNTSANSGTNKFTISQLGGNVGKRAYVVATTSGGGSSGAVTKGDVGRALGILNADGVQPSNTGQMIKQEFTDKRELTKTGIGVGTGAIAGMAIGTLVLPGIGTIAGLPVGAIIGGFIGLLA